MRRVLHAIEALAARATLRLLRAVGPVTASNGMGWLARTLGPVLPVSRVADVNLRLALPELDAAARRQIIRGVWDNLGRTVGELPHLAALGERSGDGPGWTFEGLEHVGAVPGGGPAIIVGAHIGNWEVLTVAASRLGIKAAGFYRPADNKAVDALIQAMRREAVGDEAGLFPKGARGARQALAHLAAGGWLGILADQKMNDGIEATWFGHPAMTAPALATLALRRRCTVLPAHVLRTGPAQFRVVCEAPMVLPDTGDRAADVQALTQAVNDRLEGWVRQHPASWLWLHRRYAKEVYRRV